MDNAELVFDVFSHFFELRLFDLDCTLVFLKAITSKHLHVDYGAGNTGWNALRRIFNVRGFLAKDRTQELLFWRQLSLAFRRHLTDENVTRANLSTNVYDTRLVEFAECAFADIRNISRNFFRTKFRIASDTRKLLDVNSRETIFLDYSFRN